jgi:DNA (cytosine-5)-methyltransferase 1
MEQQRIKTISLFSGAGGFDIGFESTGHFETRSAIEVDPVYYHTLQINRGLELGNGECFLDNCNLINDDIRNITGRELLRQSNIMENDLFVMYGGPPCQSFSTMGKRSGLADTRGQLIFEFSRLVRECKPTAFIFENVPNMVRQWNGKVLEMLINDFRSSEYSVIWKVLNAADYGAYTKRQRLILLGARLQDNIQLTMPQRTHYSSQSQECLFLDGLKPWNAVKNVLEDLPTPGDPAAVILRHHKAVNHSESVSQRFSHLQYGQQDKIRKRWRLDPESPAFSLMAGGNGGYVFHIHYKYPRELTARECARIQGFPDEYSFHGRPLDVAKQIVNAVPIQFAHAIAKHVRAILSPHSAAQMKS